ncbi:MAG: phosphoribosylaminoimidazolesuccinocarboxamide synthase [Pseudomonadota bacterium]
MPPDTLLHSDIQGLELLARGKVRDIYAVDDALLAIVTTDRLSAFDVVMPDPVPGKGIVLTQLSRFWFDQFQDLVANHITDYTLADVTGDASVPRSLEDRTMIVKRLRPLPMEAVARGYLIGSGWKDYQRDGAVCGHDLPSDLQLADALPTPLFTPATKAEFGEHDENISRERLADLIGASLAKRVEALTLKIYRRGAAHARNRGIIIADTKLEFGLDEEDQLHLIDEVLTPDSSRFWPESSYAVGQSPSSFDKQFVRDYLETLNWDKTAPGPALPEDVLSGTAERYQLAFDLLTGPQA